MSREKQIEEMKKAIIRIHREFLEEEECDCLDEYLAINLYEEDYRKQSENVIELPCKVGDSVWCIYNYTKPKEFQIAILTMSKNHYSFTIETKDGIYKHYCDKEAVGKWVFFTKEEAEEALAKMKGGAE
jgi:hypothetical protein